MEDGAKHVTHDPFFFFLLLLFASSFFFAFFSCRNGFLAHPVRDAIGNLEGKGGVSCRWSRTNRTDR